MIYCPCQDPRFLCDRLFCFWDGSIWTNEVTKDYFLSLCIVYILVVNTMSETPFYFHYPIFYYSSLLRWNPFQRSLPKRILHCNFLSTGTVHSFSWYIYGPLLMDSFSLWYTFQNLIKFFVVFPVTLTVPHLSFFTIFYYNLSCGLLSITLPENLIPSLKDYTTLW